MARFFCWLLLVVFSVGTVGFADPAKEAAEKQAAEQRKAEAARKQAEAEKAEAEAKREAEAFHAPLFEEPYRVALAYTPGGNANLNGELESLRPHVHGEREGRVLKIFEEIDALQFDLNTLKVAKIVTDDLPKTLANAREQAGGSELRQAISDKMAQPYEEVLRKHGVVVSSPFIPKLAEIMPLLLSRRQLKTQWTESVQWLSAEVYESARQDMSEKERGLVKAAREAIDNRGRTETSVAKPVAHPFNKELFAKAQQAAVAWSGKTNDELAAQIRAIESDVKTLDEGKVLELFRKILTRQTQIAVLTNMHETQESLAITRYEAKTASDQAAAKEAYSNGASGGEYYENWRATQKGFVLCKIKGGDEDKPFCGEPNINSFLAKMVESNHLVITKGKFGYDYIPYESSKKVFKSELDILMDRMNKAMNNDGRVQE